MATLALPPETLAVITEYVRTQGCTCEPDELTISAVVGLPTAATEFTVTFPIAFGIGHAKSCVQGKRQRLLFKAVFN